NAACTANDTDTCVSSEEFTHINPQLGTPPLRLNDPSCRNRQARRGDQNHCPLTTDGRRLENGEFKYSRDGAPCERNTASDDPHVNTPFVDEIANRAGGFPRAHVSATSSKPGRAPFLFARHNIHLAYLKNVTD